MAGAIIADQGRRSKAGANEVTQADTAGSTAATMQAMRPFLDSMAFPIP
jgi:hypothetical protein